MTARVSAGTYTGWTTRVVDRVMHAGGSPGPSAAAWSARHAATSTFSTPIAFVGHDFTQAGAWPASSRGRHMSHLDTIRRALSYTGTSYGQFQMQYWQPMHSSASWATIPLSSLV